MAKEQMPPDPMAAMAGGAIAIHEMFLGLLEGGFTEPQALYLMGVWLANVKAEGNG
jgi:hypothetical protein